jgi:hypothetical protein
MHKAKFVVIRVLYLAIFGFFAINSQSVTAQEAKIFKANRDFCEVEIRAGNTSNPMNHPVVYSGRMASGQQFSYQAVFIWAQREANPGVCGSGRGYWNQCSWGTCNLN